MTSNCRPVIWPTRPVLDAMPLNRRSGASCSSSQCPRSRSLCLERLIRNWDSDLGIYHLSTVDAFALVGHCSVFRTVHHAVTHPRLHWWEMPDRIVQIVISWFAYYFLRYV